jgi:ubiquinone/menaquinone biosynthesis C-methylase UbiE
MAAKWTWTPLRIDRPELMDAPGLPAGEVEDAYRVLRRVNRQLGNLSTMRGEVQRFALEELSPGESFSILDVGSGSGDIPEALRQAVPGRVKLVAALDRDLLAVSASQKREVDSVRGDALRLPFGDRSIDLVTAVKFAHHCSGPALDQLISELARVAARRVVVLDIRRHCLAYWGFRAWSQLFTRNRLVRYDGPLSVLRGFTREELLESAAKAPGYAWSVRGRPGFQLLLVGQRIS